VRSRRSNPQSSIAPSSRPSGEQAAKRTTGNDQPELPLAAPKQRLRVLEPEVAARVAISRRGKPSGIPGYVKLLFTLELRRELAEKLSLKAIRSERNIEAIIIARIETAARQWR